MLICDHCNKEIGQEIFKIVIYINTGVPYSLTPYKYILIGYFHEKCFNKLFIFRPETKKDRCTCGDYVLIRRNEHLIKILRSSNCFFSFSQQRIQIYHKDCFMKYWMGKKC